MNAKGWENWLRSRAKEALRSKDDAARILTGTAFEYEHSLSMLRSRLKFIVDSKSFTDAELQRLGVLWQLHDRARTTAEAILFRHRYGN